MNLGTLVNQGPPIGAGARFNTTKIDNTTFVKYLGFWSFIYNKLDSLECFK
jgi:hypothetical protein